MEFACHQCHLRPLVPADATSLALHANDRDIWLNLRDRFPHPYRLADAEQYISAVSANAVQTSFGIIVDGQAAGCVTLTPGTDVERLSAEIGYWLGRQFWGRGIMTEAVGAATTYALEHLKLVRVFAVPFATNAASMRLLEKVGYRLEGRLRRSAVKDGKVLDQFLYAYVKDEAVGTAR
jgi:[ribosomal protein S5]-alanine N-acetyltransferase